MYCNKTNVNILTSLLVAHGVRRAVVCPGSRNAAIVHNLNECPDIECFPVTDERSAGFFAIGIAQATEQAVAVCVTSGSALLNLAPAVAEAYYHDNKEKFHFDYEIINWDEFTAALPPLDMEAIFKELANPELGKEKL